MSRRQATAVLAAALALLGGVNVLVWAIYRNAQGALTVALDAELTALGKSGARWLGGYTDDRLRALADEHHLDDAYLVDGGGRIVAGARTAAGLRLDPARMDARRWQAAAMGLAQTVWVDGPSGRLERAWFPVEDQPTRVVLVLEAGEAFRAPLRVLFRTYFAAVTLSIALVLLFAWGLGRGLSALERSRLEYGRAERLAALGQMAAMVAHEVRNPLGILRAQVELMTEKGGPSERLSDMLGEIDRINRVTEEFLALARDAPLHLAACDLREVVSATLLRAKPAIREATVDVALPPSPLPVRADEAKLGQALFNLLLNAAQIGGAGVHVQIEAQRSGADALVRVADDGPGVAPELRDRVFDAFVTGRAGGSGLGLAAARHIVERHGGRLVLEPSARGASFALYLPMEPL